MLELITSDTHLRCRGQADVGSFDATLAWLLSLITPGSRLVHLLTASSLAKADQE